MPSGWTMRLVNVEEDDGTWLSTGPVFFGRRKGVSAGGATSSLRGFRHETAASCCELRWGRPHLHHSKLNSLVEAGVCPTSLSEAKHSDRRFPPEQVTNRKTIPVGTFISDRLKGKYGRRIP
jgi:hypothetical protein